MLKWLMQLFTRPMRTDWQCPACGDNRMTAHGHCRTCHASFRVPS
jgi:predicted RNA-binding Zn-ribbon protein involved in translation (DUF1610 family)